MEKVFLGLGSNVGNREKNILEAIGYLKEHIKNGKIADIYISKAVGFKNQPDFFNTVFVGYTDLSPEELFYFIKRIEKKVGRVYRFHWGPREIDIDILFYGNKIIKKDFLIIPHPRLHERDFVLKPLTDLEPDFVHPVFKKKIIDMYKGLKEFSIIGKV